MAKEFAKAFYNSSRWKKARNAYIKSRIAADGGICEECKEMPGYIVHHKVTLTADNINNPDIALNFELMEYVCKACHDEFEGHGLNGHGKEKPNFIFDDDGQPISLREIDNPPLKS